MGTHRRGTSSLQWSVADLLRREGRLRPGPVGVRGLAVGGALVCTTVVAVSMAGESENVVTSSEPEALPPAPTGPPSSVDGSDFVDTPPPAGLAPWALDSQAAASQPASPQPASPQPASPQPASPQPEPPSVPGTGSTGNAVVEPRTAEAEPRTAGAERGRDRARTTARDRPVERDFPVSGAVERSRGRHAAPPRLPDRGPQMQRDVIVRNKPSDDGREEKRRRDDTTRDGGEVVVDRDAPDDGKRRAVADEHDPGAGDSDAAARDDMTDDERDDHTRQDVEPDADVPDQRHDDVDEPDRDDAAEPRDGSDQGGQQRTPDAVLASARDRDEQSDRGGSDADDGHRSEDRPDEDDADERDRAGSDDHDHDDDLDESDEADEGQADRSDDDRSDDDRSDDDGGSEGRHRASD